MRSKIAIATVALWFGAAIFATHVQAATINGASVEQHGAVVELHFEMQGRRLRWHASIHGQQLWVDLDHTRLDLPPRPLYGSERPPVKVVRAIDFGGGHARFVIEIAGKADYAIANLPDEIVVRLARAGEVSNLAAPLLAQMGHARIAARARLPSPLRSPRVSQYVAAAPASNDDVTAEAVAPPASTTIVTAAPASPETAPASNAPAATASASAAIATTRPATAVIAPAPTTGIATASTAAAARPSVLDAAHLASDHVQMAALTPPGQPLSRAPLVMIDPGHGGYDPGAIAGRYVEKDLALAIALRLRQALVARGVSTEMTRDDDRFLSLAERTQLANTVHADLFVSVHLNSSPDPGTAGIEAYYLNNSTDRATIRLARMENGVQGGYGGSSEPNLNYILTDLRQQYKANESASLARMIEAEAAADVDASLGIKVNPLGAMRGPFYVLVGALMPAVLVECGFITNANEASLLATPRYQSALADGIADAVVHYFNAEAAVGNL
jgi:N-acetylmuramoyl-L-alanine amidase